MHIPDGTEKEIVEDLIRQLREHGVQGDMEITEGVPVQQDKQTLFQRAFRTDSTEIEITEEKISFLWFPYTADSDEIVACTQFITRLCDMAKDAKRVSSKPTETDNDKYAFRCFMLRLGFIGNEYKTARKILLRTSWDIRIYRLQ